VGLCHDFGQGGRAPRRGVSQQRHRPSEPDLCAAAFTASLRSTGFESLTNDAARVNYHSADSLQGNQSWARKIVTHTASVFILKKSKGEGYNSPLLGCPLRSLERA
jgi:hypothetical protein